MFFSLHVFPLFRVAVQWFLLFSLDFAMVSCCVPMVVQWFPFVLAIFQWLLVVLAWLLDVFLLFWHAFPIFLLVALACFFNGFQL